MENSNFNVDNSLIQLGIKHLNDIQKQTIETIKDYNKIVLLSPTGSGKTLAFLIPIINSLEANANSIQSIIVAPTRELALQIEQVFKSLKFGFKITCCYGGHPFWMETNAMKEAPDVIVGTPGRIADHIRRGTIQPALTHFLVLDEFDKCLEFGFSEEMEQITSALPSIRKTILTSATNALEIPSYLNFGDHKTLSFLADAEPCKRLKQQVIRAEFDDKFGALMRLICHVGDASMLIFVSHREASERINALLKQEGICSDVFHGGLEQSERERSLIKFRNGSIRILVATDLASRGLDIPEIEYVIHYQLPDSEEAFIHRNGRTARMKANGTSVVLLCENEALPDFLDGNYDEVKPSNDSELPPMPEWQTIFIGAGKKDKISKIDIVGFLIQQGGIDKTDIGKIDILDKSSFVAVKRELAARLVKDVRRLPIKKTKPLISACW